MNTKSIVRWADERIRGLAPGQPVVPLGGLASRGVVEGLWQLAGAFSAAQSRHDLFGLTLGKNAEAVLAGVTPLFEASMASWRAWLTTAKGIKEYERIAAAFGLVAVPEAPLAPRKPVTSREISSAFDVLRKALADTQTATRFWLRWRDPTPDKVTFSIRPPAPNRGELLAKLRRDRGKLPLQLEALYELCDGVEAELRKGRGGRRAWTGGQGVLVRPLEELVEAWPRESPVVSLNGGAGEDRVELSLEEGCLVSGDVTLADDLATWLTMLGACHGDEVSALARAPYWPHWKARIFSQPMGATVRVKGKHLGETPWVGANRWGDAEVTVSLAGYADARARLDPHGETELDLRLEPVRHASGRKRAPAKRRR